MKKEYENNLKKLKNLLHAQGIEIYPTEPYNLNEYEKSLSPYFIPDELRMLYQYVDEDYYNLMIFSLDNTNESLRFRKVVEESFAEDWIPALLPIGATDNTAVFTLLSKEPQWLCPVYCIGEGDGDLELVANNLNELISLRIAMLESGDSCIDELYRKYTPDAYLNNIQQAGVYSENGVRNIYRIDDRASLPKEWFLD